MIKKVILLSLIFCSVVNAKQIVIATGGLLGNYFQVGKDINHNVYNGKAKVINTQGSVENMLLVANGEADIALVQADALAMLETFYMSEAKTKNDLVEVVGKLYEETVHILVPERSKLHTIEELNQKVIVSGGVNSGTTLTAASIAEEYGIKFKYIRNASTAKGLKLLKRNKIDALFFVVKSPAQALLKYKHFRMIEVVDEGNKNEYLHSVAIPKDTYKFLDYDTRTYNVDTIVIVRKGSREKIRLQEYLATLDTAVVDNDEEMMEEQEQEVYEPTFTIEKEIIETYAKRYGNGALVRLNYLDRSIRRLKNKTTMEQLSKINEIVNKLNYATDRKHWKQENYWATPLETFGTSYADTEDIALLKYILLVKAGIDPKKLRLVQKNKSITILGQTTEENIALLYFKEPKAKPIVLEYTKENQPIYKYNKQFKYSIIRNAENPLWDKLFTNNVTNNDLDNIMRVLGEKR